MLKICGTLRKTGIRLFSVSVYISTAMQRNPEIKKQTVKLNYLLIHIWINEKLIER